MKELLISIAQGGGLGSSYIAEAWKDFGYLGVIIFSYIYGLILALIPQWCHKGSVSYTHLARYVGAKYAVAVSNATAGLHLAATALQVRSGDKVIVTPHPHKMPMGNSFFSSFILQIPPL